ncbi:hypothetical protein chiPu_0032259 [Chiloscyllium punctatum]|uniref:Uncharacterized protein n=1 Tax=Chiloscyllium punctatum TaxID=137246 RepID=A0A401TZY7_CHIPU|nr:hypothetical protein [Chiloscyllium punctatum]
MLGAHGCDRHPAFPAPSAREGGTKSKARTNMSRECGCVTPRRCNTFSVVPAKAGTHNHKCKLLRNAGTTSPFDNTCRGVWIPAFAGTPAGESRGCVTHLRLRGDNTDLRHLESRTISSSSWRKP